jgi:predicted nucleic acid-binding protein
MRAAIDTNVIVYAEIEPDSDKGRFARQLVNACVRHDGIIAAQVLGELLAVVRRKKPELMPHARAVVEDLAEALKISPTTGEVMCAAAALLRDHELQVWDAVICIASAEAGGTHLLSEDMQDGAVIDGLKIINPFVPSNRAEIDRLLPTL